MADTTINLNNPVTRFLDGLNHPFRSEIEQLRHAVLSAQSGLAENIKWNGPNYCFNNEDRITMRIQPPKREVQLIFHRGTKKREQPQERLINDDSGLLTWKENDRAIMTFKSSAEIENNKGQLRKVISDWLSAAS